MPAKPMTDDRKAGENRRVFRALLTAHDLMLKDSAELIALHTGRPCSYRTVKSWMADSPEVSTARPCPDWAVVALRGAVERPDVLERVRTSSSGTTSDRRASSTGMRTP